MKVMGNEKAKKIFNELNMTPMDVFKDHYVLSESMLAYLDQVDKEVDILLETISESFLDSILQ